ncbi:MAG: Asp-tRNA(Asn)/Glu-tRNA(Gln) amidotransferase subunit GatC [Patescibacteria group bacterium]
MNITRAQTEQLAGLVRLELTATEIDQLVEQLPKIVDYVAQLQRVETTTVAEALPLTEQLRADTVKPSAATDAILAQAPDRTDRLWKVDAVFS